MKEFTLNDVSRLSLSQQQLFYSLLQQDTDPQTAMRVVTAKTRKSTAKANNPKPFQLMR